MYLLYKVYRQGGKEKYLLSKGKNPIFAVKREGKDNRLF